MCIFLSELAGCHSLRTKETWLLANWDGLRDIFGLQIHQKSPSDSTLCRILNNINARLLQNCVSDLLRKLLPLNIKQGIVVHYALDGKSRSGVCSPITGRTEIDLTLYHSNSSTIIGKYTLEDKQGESKVAPEIITDIFINDFQNGVITFDCAMTTPKVTESIIDSGNEYLGAIKGFNGNVYEIAEEYDWGSVESCVFEKIKGHGRVEEREMKIINISNLIQEKSDEFQKYKESGFLLRVERKRSVMKTGRQTIEYGYFIGSVGLCHLKVEEIFEIQKNHWLIENQSNWVRDVVLNEDKCATKSRNASQFLGAIRDLVLHVGFNDGNKRIKNYITQFAFNPMEKLLNVRSLDSYEVLSKYGLI